MKVVVVAATEQEISRLRKALPASPNQAGIAFSFCVSGVGLLASCFAITEIIYQQTPDLIIQAGIAGAFYNSIALRTVVAVNDEYTGDMGAEENGLFKDLFDLNLLEADTFPFREKKLTNPHLPAQNLLQLPVVATAVTVNEITTRPERITQLIEKYNPAIESMEGAALHYCCLKTNTPFIQIRAVSNYVGERDKNKWAFQPAFENLSKTMVAYAEMLARS